MPVNLPHNLCNHYNNDHHYKEKVELNDNFHPLNDEKYTDILINI